jgi:hypothetical protein
MNKKTFMVLGALGSLALMAAAGGCSSTPATNDGGTGDSGTVTDGSKKDVVVPTDGGGGGMCPTPADVSGFTPPTKVHDSNAPAQKCTNAQIAAFYTNCIDDATATNMTCTNWTNMGADAAGSNKDCGACIYTQSTASKYGPVVAGQGLISLNISGCLQVNGATTCALSYEVNQQCGKLACDDQCPVSDNATFAKYQQCRTNAANGGCKTYATKADMDCPEDAGNVATCTNFADFQAGYAKISQIFCNPGNL